MTTVASTTTVTNSTRTSSGMPCGNLVIALLLPWTCPDRRTRRAAIPRGEPRPGLDGDPGLLGYRAAGRARRAGGPARRNRALAWRSRASGIQPASALPPLLPGGRARRVVRGDPVAAYDQGRSDRHGSSGSADADPMPASVQSKPSTRTCRAGLDCAAPLPSSRAACAGAAASAAVVSPIVSALSILRRISKPPLLLCEPLRGYERAFKIGST